MVDPLQGFPSQRVINAELIPRQGACYVIPIHCIVLCIVDALLRSNIGLANSVDRKGPNLIPVTVNITIELQTVWHGPLARYVKLRVAHAPGMPGWFSPTPRVGDPDMHHGTCVTHVPWCMPGSLTSSFPWSIWWGKRSRHCQRMRNPQFYVSGKRPI